MSAVAMVYPVACVHCGKSLANIKPVGERTYQAALAILRGAQTSSEVAAKLKTSVTTASNLLKRAERAKLVTVFARKPHSERGGMICFWRVTRTMRAFAPAEFQRAMPVHDIAS